MIVRPETEADISAISDVVTAAFQSTLEAQLVARLRREGHVLVSLVAVDQRQVVGSAVFSHLQILTKNRSIEAAALAPVAVHPEFQQTGIGSALILEGLRICKARGKEAVIVLGDAEYYARFGFSPGLARGIASKYAGPGFMALELAPGALHSIVGSVTYPAAFDDLG